MEFQLDTRYTLTPNQGTITVTGISAVNKFLYEQTLREGEWSLLNPNTPYTRLPALPTTFDWEWTTKQGKLPKRVARFYHGMGIKFPKQVIEQLGNLAKSHYQEPTPYVFEFVNKFNWRKGDFGDPHSCYWGSNKAARQVLTDNGAFAVRFYNAEQKGIARAWFVKLETFAIVFNGYGFPGDATLTIVKILAGFFTLPYTRIHLENNGHASGLVYINGGVGYTIGHTDITFHDFQWETPYEHECRDCGNGLNEDDVYWGLDNEPYCQDCFYESFEYCSQCGETCWRDNSYYVNDETYCPSCYERDCFYCEECGEDYLIGEAHEFQGRLYCESCLPRVIEESK